MKLEEKLFKSYLEKDFDLNYNEIRNNYLTLLKWFERVKDKHTFLTKDIVKMLALSKPTSIEDLEELDAYIAEVCGEEIIDLIEKQKLVDFLDEKYSKEFNGIHNGGLLIKETIDKTLKEEYPDFNIDFYTLN